MLRAFLGHSASELLYHDLLEKVASSHPMMLKIISPDIVRKRFGQSGDIALDSGVVPYQKVVLAAVRKNGLALQYAVPMYVNDEIVLEAVRNNGLALEWASPQHVNDEIVLEAVRNNGLALEWASPQHRMDKGIVFEAVRQNAAALQWASAQCRADRHVANQEVWHGLAQQAALGRERKTRMRRCLVFEANRVANPLPQCVAQLVGNTLRNADRS